MEELAFRNGDSLTPRFIGPIWTSPNGVKPDNCSEDEWNVLNDHAMLFSGTNITLDNESEDIEKNRRVQCSSSIDEEFIPDLIKLVHLNTLSRVFLVDEFSEHLKQYDIKCTKKCIKLRIQQLAVWQTCTEKTNSMFKKKCWCVSTDTLKQYNLNNSSFPQYWSYKIIPPLRTTTKSNKKKSDDECKQQKTKKKFTLPKVILDALLPEDVDKLKKKTLNKGPK